MENENEPYFNPRILKGYMDKVTGPSFAEIGISFSSAPFICEIRKNEGISLKGLTDLLMVDKAHTTRVVSKLIDSGLVENRAQGHEYSLFLTEKGKETAMEADLIFKKAWNGIIRDLTVEEKETFDVILRKMSNVIKEEIQ